MYIPTIIFFVAFIDHIFPHFSWNFDYIFFCAAKAIQVKTLIIKKTWNDFLFAELKYCWKCEHSKKQSLKIIITTRNKKKTILIAFLLLLFTKMNKMNQLSVEDCVDKDVEWCVDNAWKLNKIEWMWRQDEKQTVLLFSVCTMFTLSLLNFLVLFFCCFWYFPENWKWKQ